MRQVSTASQRSAPQSVAGRSTRSARSPRAEAERALFSFRYLGACRRQNAEGPGGRSEGGLKTRHAETFPMPTPPTRSDPRRSGPRRSPSARVRCIASAQGAAIRVTVSRKGNQLHPKKLSYLYISDRGSILLRPGAGTCRDSGTLVTPFMKWHRAYVAAAPSVGTGGVIQHVAIVTHPQGLRRAMRLRPRARRPWRTDARREAELPTEPSANRIWHPLKDEPFAPTQHARLAWPHRGSQDRWSLTGTPAYALYRAPW